MVGERLSSSVVRESDSMESLVVMGGVPVSATARNRSGALWNGPSPLGSLAYGGMDELACRVVAADAQGVVVWAFPGIVCACVRHFTERAFICQGVTLSRG